MHDTKLPCSILKLPNMLVGQFMTQYDLWSRLQTAFDVTMNVHHRLLSFLICTQHSSCHGEWITYRLLSSKIDVLWLVSGSIFTSGNLLSYYGLLCPTLAPQCNVQYQCYCLLTIHHSNCYSTCIVLQHFRLICPVHFKFSLCELCTYMLQLT